MIQQFERLVHRLWMLVGRGKTTTVNDAGPIQMVQVKLGADEVRDNTRRAAEYGFTSSPPAGSDAVLVFVGGDRSNGVVIATNHQASRLKNLQPGEVAIFDNQGQSVYLTRAGIVVNGAGLPLTVNSTPVVTVNAATKIALNTPELDVSGQIKAGGDITDNSASSGKSMAQMRSIYNGHGHPVPGVQAGSSTVNTNPPTQQE
ncbi:phage baseplate assembly protein [Chromobacterium haemolyticum]|uniref:Phage baseplate assembly protein n=1 Tax=Chromobacterium fluminis TaxID=3044269 RepID=A0ABX0LA27_9NEIS|nr:phage baseplate assembly protein V [Chromobacterium haemolyticum]NHR07640.1 phage baseplate assembly protein [Chromobacterium haemolyticum]